MGQARSSQQTALNQARAQTRAKSGPKAGAEKAVTKAAAAPKATTKAKAAKAPAYPTSATRVGAYFDEARERARFDLRAAERTLSGAALAQRRSSVQDRLRHIDLAERALSDAEHRAATLIFERAEIVGIADGKVKWGGNGDGYHVEIPGKQFSKLFGAVITHNHPTIPGDPGTGGSFSLDDWRVAAAGGVKAMRAVGGGYVYEITPATGGRRPGERGWSIDHLHAVIEPAYKKAMAAERRTANKELKANPRLANSKAWQREITHRVNERVAAATGGRILYTRVPIGSVYADLEKRPGRFGTKSEW